MDIELRNPGHDHKSLLVPSKSCFTCPGRQPSIPGGSNVEFHSGVKFRFKIAVTIAAQYIMDLRMAEFRHYKKKTQQCHYYALGVP